MSSTNDDRSNSKRICRSAVATGNALPGTYALVLKCHTAQQVQIGRWRQIEVQPGYYVYIGSAFGPGGVRARVARHFRTAKKNHWHIDYLREQLLPRGAWISYAPVRLEHRWAERLSVADGFTPLSGFGSSDCPCPTHLFHTSTEHSLARLWHGDQLPVLWWPFSSSPFPTPPSADSQPNGLDPPIGEE